MARTPALHEAIGRLAGVDLALDTEAVAPQDAAAAIRAAYEAA